MYNRGLFHTWVPKPVQLLLIIVFLIAILPANGIYSGNIGDMVGSLGSLAEDISMANNATTIGMMVVFPLLLRTKTYLPTKVLLAGSLAMLGFLSIVCGTTDSVVVITLCSFLIGIFKMFATLEVILPVMFILSPSGDRGRFYSIFYPFSIMLGQVMSYYTTLLAARMQWQYSYIFMAVLLLGAALLAIVFMHNQRGSKKVPLYYFDWLSMVMLSVSLLCLDYVLVYAKQQNWLESFNIQLATAGFVLTMVIFIKRQLVTKRPYLPLAVLGKKNVYNALLMIFLMGMFMATGSIQSAFTTGVLRYDAATNASLNLLMIPGVVLGGIVSFIWFKKKWWLKTLALIGFGAYQVYVIYMYLLIAPVVEMEMFIIPTIIRGFAMCVLFIAFGFYIADKLQMMQMLSASAVLIVVRSFVGPAFFGAVFSWAQYKLHLQHVSNLAGQMDSAMLGSSALSLYGTVQIQALMMAAKQLLGYVIMAGWAVLIYVSLHRFLPIHFRRMILLRKRWRYKEPTEGYKVSGDVSAGVV
jgi:MFS family permease